MYACELQQRQSRLPPTLFTLEKRNRAKQEIVRSERLIKKLRQDVESIKVETSVLPATLKTRRNNR